MRRAVLALALLVAAAAAVLAASPAELHQRTIEFRRELRRQAVTRTLSNEDLLARLEALKAEHEKDPDPKVAKSLERAETNLKLLMAGRPLPVPEEGESEPVAGPAVPEPPAPERPMRPSPVLNDAPLVAVPESAADYFDRSKTHAAAPPVSVPDKMPNADLSGYLALKDEAAQRAHLREKTAKLLAALALSDPLGARASYLADRLHKHLSGHARREKFATLRVRAVDGRLRLAYVLKDGTAAEEDLGPIAEWTTPPATGGGGAVGGGRDRASKSPKDAKSAKGSKSGGGGGRRGGASRSAKRASKGGGKAFDGGGDDGDAGSIAGGGKGRGRGGRGRGAASDGGAAMGSASGPGGKGKGRAGDAAALGRPRAKAGKGLSSGEGSGSAFSARRATAVPLPKGFAARSVKDPVAGGSSKGAGGSAKGGGGGRDVTGAPPKSKAGKGNLPDGLTKPTASTAIAAATRAQTQESAGLTAASGPVPHPASMTADDELRDAVAAHEARLPAVTSVPFRSVPAGAGDEPASSVSWEVLMAALGATAIAAALLQARRAERPLAS